MTLDNAKRIANAYRVSQHREVYETIDALVAEVEKLNKEINILDTSNHKMRVALQKFSDYVRDEQFATDGQVSYSTTQINHLVFLARSAME